MITPDGKRVRLKKLEETVTFSDKLSIFAVFYTWFTNSGVTLGGRLDDSENLGGHQ
jgi:hypothetical protein